MSCQQVPTAPAFNPYPRSVQVGEFEVAIGGGIWVAIGDLEQLLLIKKWTAAGLSLERIRELLHGGSAPVPPRAPAMGSVSVRSHLMVADGIEVVIDPGLAGLSPEQVRHFTRAVMAAFAQVQGEGAPHTNQEENQDGQAQ